MSEGIRVREIIEWWVQEHERPVDKLMDTRAGVEVLTYSGEVTCKLLLSRAMPLVTVCVNVAASAESEKAFIRGLSTSIAEVIKVCQIPRRPEVVRKPDLACPPHRLPELLDRITWVQLGRSASLQNY